MKASFFNSLAARLALGAAVWSAALLIAVGFLLSSLFSDHVERSFDSRLLVMLDSVVAGTDVDTDGFLQIDAAGEGRFETPFSGWYWQIDGGAAGRVRSRSLWDQALPIPETMERSGTGAAIYRRDSAGPDGRPVRAVGRAVTFPALVQPVVFQVAGDLSQSRQEISRFNELLGWSLALLFFGLLGAIVVQVRFGLRPLRQIRDSLARIRQGKADRLGGTFPNEIAPLAQEINVLLQHNAAVLERARTHVGNLAHALKTPITIITNEIGRAPGPWTRAVAHQIALVRRQIDHHLARARTAATGDVLGVRTPVLPVLDDLRRTLDRIHADRAIVITVDCPGDLVFAGERQDLEEMAGNLMDNACKWASACVDIGCDAGEGRVRIQIVDDGPGLSEADRQAALQRGNRLDESTPGSGLGLAIVADIAGLYDGELILSEVTAGGLCANLDLPAAAKD